MKKYISILLACMLFFSFAIPTYAEESSEWYEMVEVSEEEWGEEPELVNPYTLYIMNVITSIKDGGNGKIYLHAVVSCTTEMQTITTVFYLQKHTSSGWVNVSSGTTSVSDSATLSKTMSVSGASAGTYRVRTETLVRTYSGYPETTSGYSGNITIS